MDNYPSREQIEKWHNDPSNWKLGLFYFNKEDNRILVDKKPAWMGTTINFAHRQSYLVMLPAIGFFGFIVFMITKYGQSH